MKVIRDGEIASNNFSKGVIPTSVQLIGKITIFIWVIFLVWSLGSGCQKKVEKPAENVYISVEQVIRNHTSWLLQQRGVVEVHSHVLEDGEEVIQIVFDKKFDSYLHLPVELGGYKIKIHLQ